MNKAEIISQLESLRDSQAGMAKQPMPDDIFIRDVEALDAAINFLNSGDRRIPTGEWIYDSRTGEPRCSKCGENAVDGIITPYCPNCGAKMEEEDENGRG